MATDVRDQYTRGPILGRGAYKTVFRAIDRSKGIEVAWNEVRLEGDVNFNKLVAEITMLRSLKGGYFIGCYESWIDEAACNLIFISELMESGNLKSFIHEANGVSIGVMKDYCSQILKGLLYIHTLNPPIIHRDIKLDNIFFHGPAGQVKIGDLGIATLIDPIKGQKPKTVCGTPEFMAPEFYTENYNEKVDIWAFGLCVLEMVTLEYPYEECGNNYINVFKVVSAGLKPRILAKIKDDTIVDFICRCLEKDQAKRPSAEELFPDPFLVRRPGDTSKFAEFRNAEEIEAILSKIGTTEEGWNKFIAEITEPVKQLYEHPEIQEGVKIKLEQLAALKEKNLLINAELAEETPSPESEPRKSLLSTPVQPRPTTPPVAWSASKPIYNEGPDEDDVILDDDTESKEKSPVTSIVVSEPTFATPDVDEIIDDIDLLVVSGSTRQTPDRPVRPQSPSPIPTGKGTSQDPAITGSAPSTPLRTPTTGAALVASTKKFDKASEDVLIDDDEPMSSSPKRKLVHPIFSSSDPKDAKKNNPIKTDEPKDTEGNPKDAKTTDPKDTKTNDPKDIRTNSPTPAPQTQPTQLPSIVSPAAMSPQKTAPLSIPVPPAHKVESPDDNNTDIDNFLLKNLTHFQSSSVKK